MKHTHNWKIVEDATNYAGDDIYLCDKCHLYKVGNSQRQLDITQKQQREINTLQIAVNELAKEIKSLKAEINKLMLKVP